MTFYNIRKNKAKTGHIITFKQSFFEKIKNEDGWIIRVFINTLLKKINEYKVNIVIDLESESEIEKIIKENGETIFNDPIIHHICFSFISGIEKSNLKEVPTIYMTIKTFFEKINKE